MAESKKLDPIISEFETEEAAIAYNTWFLAQVDEALADPGPDIPHDEAMAQVKAVIRQAAKKRA